jgi:hypothetical protein
MNARSIISGVAFALLAHSATAQRQVDYVLRSNALPRLTVTITGSLPYIGSIKFPVGAVAEAQEFVFGAASGDELTRAVVVHFENFLPGTPHKFQYPQLRMTRLGSEDYLHQTWGFGDFSLFQEPAMRDLLSSKGLRAGPRWVVDRYVRALPDNPQYEVIIFYLESSLISDPSMLYGGAPIAPPPPPTPSPSVEAAIHSRARASFTVWATDQAPSVK